MKDAISRQYVIEKLNGMNGTAELDNVFEIVENAPSVTPKGVTVTDFADRCRECGKQKTRWIPVKEHLPETDGDYLLFGKIDDFDDEYYKFIGEYDAAAEKFGICRDCFDPNTLGCLGSEFYEYGEVLAWMPLPDDYKEEVEE